MGPLLDQPDLLKLLSQCSSWVRSSSSPSLIRSSIKFPVWSSAYASLVTFEMQCKVVWPGEGSITMTTLEWLCACVFSVMSCEFIRTRKSPLTAIPRASIWFFTCKIIKLSIKYNHLFFSSKINKFTFYFYE